MKPLGSNTTILHVEDNRELSFLVQRVFEDLGFSGNFLLCGGVQESISLLSERERENRPIHLFLIDMDLPDGTGLDVIRCIKDNPYWSRTPVIVLSNRSDPRVVDAAYALGAACYLPKLPSSGRVFETLEALYRCWMENAIWPENSYIDRLQSAIARGAAIRARSANFFLIVARTSTQEPYVNFWLECALREGNMSNLLAFVQSLVREQDAPLGILNRFITMQDNIELALQKAEHRLQKVITPDLALLCSDAIDIFSAAEEGITMEVLDYLLKITPAAAASFRKHAQEHLNAISGFVLSRTTDQEVHKRAKRLQAWAAQMK